MVQYLSFFTNNIRSYISTLDFELVVYDETEYFRAYDDLEFNYPYIPRKQKMERFYFSIPTSETQDYSVNSVEMKFQRTEACLEPDVFQQMQFIGQTQDLAKSLFSKYVLKEE